MIGRRLEHYSILDRLGAGGMGVVYCALDESGAEGAFVGARTKGHANSSAKKRCPQPGGRLGRDADDASLGGSRGITEETGHNQPHRTVSFDGAAGGAQRKTLARRIKGYQEMLLLKERLNPSRIPQKEMRTAEVA